jgi:23S rRNA pseudouridine1911/1915/1917 synthase
MSRLSETWKAGKDGSALATELHQILEVSHRQAKGLIDSGCVSVNGDPAKNHGLRLKEGDEIVVVYDPDTAYKALPKPGILSDIPFEVLWEDKHLVFVNKPAGLLTVPAEKGNEPCLAESLTDMYRRRGFKRFQLFIVHRLDRHTSGVLVFAKTPEALHGLKNIFEEHHLHRAYRAVLVGELPENAGTLTHKLVERKSLRMAVAPVRAEGKKDVKGARLAITHYRVLERFPGHTLVEVKLETGRRNQIRVQFADRGFPLLGDHVYGEVSPLIDRQALHAEVLGFRHPVTDEAITVMAPLPPDMEAVLKTLRNVHRVVRAKEGLKGEEGIFKPRIQEARKVARIRRSVRFRKDGPEGGPAEGRPAPERTGPAREGSRPARGQGPEDRPRPARPRTASGSEGPRPARPHNRETPGTGSPRPRPSTTTRRAQDAPPRPRSSERQTPAGGAPRKASRPPAKRGPGRQR